MGIFSFFASPDPQSIAVKLRDHALALKTTDVEQRCAFALGVELQKYIEERLLMRIGFTEAAIAHYAFEEQSRKIWDVKDLVAQMFVDQMTTRPGVSIDAGGALYARAAREYTLQQPNELAAKLLTNLYDGEYRPVDSAVGSQFVQLVHGLLRETMVAVRDLTAKLKP